MSRRDASSYYYLHPSNNSSKSLITYLLTGDNHNTWSKAIMNALHGRNEAGFITGDFIEPVDVKSPEFSAWKANKFTICCWLLNSVDVSIQPSVCV